MADDYTTKKKKMVADAERERAAKEFVGNEKDMGRYDIGRDPKFAENVIKENKIAAEELKGTGRLYYKDAGRDPSGDRTLEVSRNKFPPVVRGVPEEMTAEYSSPKMTSEAARAAVSRMKKAMDEQGNDTDDLVGSLAAGAGLGAAVGGGLAGPVGVPVGGLAGSFLGGIGYGANRQIKDRGTNNERKEAARAIKEALQAGAFTKEELDAAAAERGFQLDY
jgi:hypothetical protein